MKVATKQKNIEKIATRSERLKEMEKTMGRPVLWKSPEELQAKIDECKKWCLENNRPLTLSRLAEFIGCDRSTLANYSIKDNFFHTLKRAKVSVEANMEEILISGKAPVGAIFSLKNNFGWLDAKQVNVNEQLTITNVVSQLSGGAIDGELIDEGDESEAFLLEDGEDDEL